MIKNIMSVYYNNYIYKNHYVSIMPITSTKLKLFF